MNPNRKVKTFTDVKKAVAFKRALREKYSKKGITHRRIRLKSRVDGTFDVVSYDFIKELQGPSKNRKVVDRKEDKWSIIEDLIHDLMKPFTKNKES